MYSSQQQLSLSATRNSQAIITQCYLPLGHLAEVTISPIPAEAGTRSSDSEGIQGWVDLRYVKTDRPGIEPETYQSQIQRPTAAPWHFWYIWRYLLTIADCNLPTRIWRPRCGDAMGISPRSLASRTRVSGLSFGVVLVFYTACDGRTYSHNI